MKRHFYNHAYHEEFVSLRDIWGCWWLRLRHKIALTLGFTVRL